MTTRPAASPDEDDVQVARTAAADFYVIADPAGENFLPYPTRPAMTVATAIAAVTRPDNPLSVWRVVSTSELLALRRDAFNRRVLTELHPSGPGGHTPHPEPCLAFDGGQIIGHYLEASALDGLRVLQFSWRGRRFIWLIDLDEPASFPSDEQMLAAQQLGRLA